MPEAWQVTGSVTESDVLKALVSVRGREIARRFAGPDADASMTLAVGRSRHRGVTVLALAGELDVGTAGTLRDVLSAAIEDGPVVADLRAVEFIDSMGLGALVAARRRGPGRIAVVISDDQPVVRKVFETTALDRALVVAPSVDEAVSALTTDAVA